MDRSTLHRTTCDVPGKSLGRDRQFLQICATRSRSALPITETELRDTRQIWRESVQLQRNGRVGIQPPTCEIVRYNGTVFLFGARVAARQRSTAACVLRPVAE